MSGYLAQWYDPALDIPADETIEAITKQEVVRLVNLLAVATAAGNMPRRLGGDATSDDLAVDKRRCRRIAHVAVQLLDAWDPKQKLSRKATITGREAAIVDWKKWLEEHRTWLINRQRYVATWCMKYDADEKWCKSALVRLNNELRWSEYALRD